MLALTPVHATEPSPSHYTSRDRAEFSSSLHIDHLFNQNHLQKYNPPSPLPHHQPARSNFLSALLFHHLLLSQRLVGRSDLLDFIHRNRGIHFGGRGLLAGPDGLLLEVSSADGRVAGVVAVACSNHGGGGKPFIYSGICWCGSLDCLVWRAYGEDGGGD